MLDIVEHLQNSMNINQVLGLLQYHLQKVAKYQHTSKIITNQMFLGLAI